MRILSYWRLLKGLRYMIVFRLLLINEELIDPCSTQASANIFSVKIIEPSHAKVPIRREQYYAIELV